MVIVTIILVNVTINTLHLAIRNEISEAKKYFSTDLRNQLNEFKSIISILKEENLWLKSTINIQERESVPLNLKTQ